MPEGRDSSLVILRTQKAVVIQVMETSLMDQRVINQIQEELLDLADKAQWPRFVISFDGVKIVSSAALGMLVTVNKKVAKLKGQVRITNLGKQMQELFKITAFDKIFKIDRTTDDALAKIG